MAKDQTVIDLLLEQHQQIRQLFTKVSNATGEAKRNAFDDLVRLLAVHESAEEQIVHPVARKQGDAAEAVVQARLDEEDEAKKALADLYDLGVDHPEFDSRLEAFATDVLVHAMHEEQEEFPRLREAVSDDRLKTMAGALKAAEAVAPTRPHRAAGESAMANVLAGPPLAVFDRVRDAVRDWSKKNAA
jgi:hemerythrin superfamily protein